MEKTNFNNLLNKNNTNQKNTYGTKSVLLIKQIKQDGQERKFEHIDLSKYKISKKKEKKLLTTIQQLIAKYENRHISNSDEEYSSDEDNKSSYSSIAKLLSEKKQQYEMQEPQQIHKQFYTLNFKDWRQIDCRTCFSESLSKEEQEKLFDLSYIKKQELIQKALDDLILKIKETQIEQDQCSEKKEDCEKKSKEDLEKQCENFLQIFSYVKSNFVMPVELFRVLSNLKNINPKIMEKFLEFKIENTFAGDQARRFLETHIKHLSGASNSNQNITF